jgi:hypothetical protein
MKIIITEEQLTDLLSNKNQKNIIDAILVTGIVKDKSHHGQVQDFKNGLGKSKIVLAYTFSESNSIINAVKKYNDVPVVLFSWGCILAGDVARNMIDKSNLYIVEPWGKGDTSPQAVRSAIQQGVPISNVFIGPSIGRGLGIVSGATSKTPRGLNHFQALEYVGSLLR